jgi:hypothetical protein
MAECNGFKTIAELLAEEREIALAEATENREPEE